MKSYINLSVLFVIIFYIGCSNSTSNEDAPNEAVTIDTTVQIKTPKAVEQADFSDFWRSFAANIEDKSFLKKHTYFPYGDGYVGVITEADFDKEDFNHLPHFFGETQQVSAKQLQENDYLNYQLEELFIEQFGNKEDIFVVKKEADPMGYLAYFKLMDNKFWFIGYEELQDASH